MSALLRRPSPDTSRCSSENNRWPLTAPSTTFVPRGHRCDLAIDAQARMAGIKFKRSRAALVDLHGRIGAQQFLRGFAGGRSLLRILAPKRQYGIKIFGTVCVLQFLRQQVDPRFVRLLSRNRDRRAAENNDDGELLQIHAASPMGDSKSAYTSESGVSMGAASWEPPHFAIERSASVHSPQRGAVPASRSKRSKPREVVCETMS
jgi:hypothetical protein